MPSAATGARKTSRRRRSDYVLVGHGERAPVGPRGTSEVSLGDRLWSNVALPRGDVRAWTVHILVPRHPVWVPGHASYLFQASTTVSVSHPFFSSTPFRWHLHGSLCFISDSQLYLGRDSAYIMVTLLTPPRDIFFQNPAYAPGRRFNVKAVSDACMVTLPMMPLFSRVF